MAIDEDLDAEQLSFVAEPEPEPELEDESADLRRRIDAALAAAQRADERNGAGTTRRARRASERPAQALPPPERLEPTEEEAPALSVSEFYEQVRAALSAAFPGEVWVVGEIRSVRVSKGHHYIELADENAATGERGTAAQLEVCCWARDWPRIDQQLSQAGVSLEAGRVVRVRGRVSVFQGGSKLRFTLTEIDIAAMLGGIAAARRQLLAALEREGLLGRNRSLVLAPVPLRIGLVTSPGSEAHRDFVGQLDRSGYRFSVQLESTLVQGAEAPGQIAAALGRLAEYPIDLAVIVRGGGSRGDLAAFDSEPVARAIATADFPVWTGIGHSGDRSVADEVASLALITPTQCGEAVVARVCQFLDEVDNSVGRLAKLTRQHLDAAAAGLDNTTATLRRIAHNELDWKANDLRNGKLAIARGAASVIEHEASTLSGTRRTVAVATRRRLEDGARRVAQHQQVLRAYDPARQLERGWSLTCDLDGRLIRSVAGLAAGTRIATRLADGQAISVVDSAEAKDRR